MADKMLMTTTHRKRPGWSFYAASRREFDSNPLTATAPRHIYLAKVTRVEPPCRRLHRLRRHRHGFCVLGNHPVITRSRCRTGKPCSPRERDARDADTRPTNRANRPAEAVAAATAIAAPRRSPARPGAHRGFNADGSTIKKR